MRHFLLLIPFWFLAAAQAQSSSWTERFMTEECGMSERQAQLRARAAAQQIVDMLRQRCADEDGRFESRQRDGYCSPYEEGNFHCPTRCTVNGTASCLF